jgi:hypothetical protein
MFTLLRRKWRASRPRMNARWVPLEATKERSGVCFGGFRPRKHVEEPGALTRGGSTFTAGSKRTRRKGFFSFFRELPRTNKKFLSPLERFPRHLKARPARRILWRIGIYKTTLRLQWLLISNKMRRFLSRKTI